MRITQPGNLAPGLTYVGHPGILLYLVQGSQSALIDSGMTVMGGLIRQDLERELGGVEALDWQLLTHSHYDHISGTPSLKRRHPDLKVAAHAGVGRVLERPNAIDLIRRLNETVLGGPPPADDPDMVEFAPFPIDRELADGEILDLGRGITVEVLHTPGHTRDSVSYYLPHAKAVVPAEAAGVPDLSGHIMPEFLQSYEDYMASLERLAGLDLAFICLPHNHLIAGDEARAYMGDSIAATTAFRTRIERALDTAGGDQEAVVAELMNALYSSDHGQPADAFRINLVAMVQAVARELGAGEGA